MYKLPESVKESTVYKGFKIAVGWRAVRKFFAALRKDGYFIYRMLNSYSSNDGYELAAEFYNEGYLYTVKSCWSLDGSRDLLRSKYKMDSLEITDAPLQD